MAQTVPRSEIGLCSAVIPRIRTAPPVLRFYGHVQMLLPDGSICEILLIFYDFCGQESFMLPFFPAHHFFFLFLCRLEYFSCQPSLFLLIFYGPRARRWVSEEVWGCKGIRFYGGNGNACHKIKQKIFAVRCVRR